MSLQEPYRPQYHFTPPANWMNDPNGLVFYAGEYHLFYQHHPDAPVWGPMHWGHAVSPDLIHWQHLPIALYPDENGTIFSGSAVIDWRDTAGFGAEAMIALFTHANGNLQSQSLAYSTDKGRTWTKYAGNPILTPPPHLRDFRDPKVFWYGDADTGHWVMAVAAGNAILFYTSPDLKTWKPSGGFVGYGSTEGVWETPDLFPLPVDGGPDTRWVLIVGVGDGAPARGSGTQYFVGHFDGSTFTSENPKEAILWADYGADFYAAQSWSDEPQGRRLIIGWMSNWQYANTTPTTTWRSAFTLPRELSLTATPLGIRLIQHPLPELHTLRKNSRNWQNQTIPANTQYPLTNPEFELLAEIQIPPNVDADRVGLRLLSEFGKPITIGYATKSRTLFIDRPVCEETTPFSSDFAGIHQAPLPPQNGVIRLHLYVDRSSVEVFANNGQIVLTDQIFPCSTPASLEVFVDGGTVSLQSLVIYGLHRSNFSVT